MTRTESPRRGRPRIPRERIIDTALQIVDDHGADALTLRALAEELGSSTATLYRHVDSRAELIGLVIDRMLADIDLPTVEDDDTQPWDTVCHRTALAVFATITRHGRVAPLLVEQFPTGPHAIALRERIARAVLRGGMDSDSAASTVATLARYILGFAMQSAAEDAASPPTYHVDPARSPSLALIAAHLPKPLADEFEFGLTAMLRGLRVAPGKAG